jgi:hypothetical protein
MTSVGRYPKVYPQISPIPEKMTTRRIREIRAFLEQQFSGYGALARRSPV